MRSGLFAKWEVDFVPSLLRGAVGVILQRLLGRELHYDGVGVSGTLDLQSLRPDAGDAFVGIGDGLGTGESRGDRSRRRRSRARCSAFNASGSLLVVTKGFIVLLLDGWFKRGVWW